MSFVELWEEEGEDESDSGSHDRANRSLPTKEGEDHKDEDNGTVATHNTLELVGKVAW